MSAVGQGLDAAVQRIIDELRADGDDWRALALRLARAAREDVPALTQQARADAWDEGHKTRWRRDWNDGCECSAWSSGECACGKYGTGRLLSLGDNPYRAAAVREGL